MTSPAEPVSGDAPPASQAATPARQLTDPLRELIAFVLLGANAVLLFVGLIRLLAPTQYSTFYSRAGSGFFSFAGLEAAVLPVLAVLLAAHVAPVARRAKVITQVALAEYAFGALFGALTLLIWTVDRLAKAEVLDAFLGLLMRAAWLAIFAAGAFVVFRIWRVLYYTPKPKPAPGVYGQPQPGWPQQPGQPGQQGGWGAPGQQGGWSGGGYPAQGQPGTGQFGQPTAPYGQPGAPFAPAPASAPPFAAAPQSSPPFAAPQSSPPFAAPQSSPPFAAAPQSAPPAPQPGSPFAATPQSAPPAPQSAPPFPAAQPQSAPPFGQPPSAEPTQAIPQQPTGPGASDGHQDGDAERTERFRRED
ncbi:hypothetical protein [Micromonospora okii]|uniref:hypothetical protein n=1 Tax=Micromonospora okii TaxID=1182970 RepID=UPI001E533FAE|nr:hypothetical protein [Micromonospora okii]